MAYRMVRSQPYGDAGKTALRVLTAIGTGGLSEVGHAVAKKVSKDKAKKAQEDANKITKRDWAKIWKKDPAKRTVIPSTFTSWMSPEEAIIALALGSPSTFATRPFEDRATIYGGIAALQAKSGKYANVNLDTLIVEGSGAQTKAQDEKLIKAAGGRLTGDRAKDLKNAGKKIRDEAARAGVGELAFAIRAQKLLGSKTVKAFIAAHGVALGILGLIPVVNIFAGTAGTAHTLKIQIEMQTFLAKIKRVVEKWQEKFAKNAQYNIPPESEQALPPVEDAGVGGMPAWVPYAAGGAGVLLVGGALIAWSRRKA